MSSAQVAFAYDVSHISGTDLHPDHPDRGGPDRAAPGGRAAQPGRAALPGGEHRPVVPGARWASSGIVFVHLGGQDGLNFILPFLMFVFLMALGSDYNILIMSRIREEAHGLPLRDAVARAIGRTGQHDHHGRRDPGRHASPCWPSRAARRAAARSSRSATASRPGVLMDTFLLRSLLVPSLVVLLGRWNWWPSHLAREAGPVSPTPSGADSDRPRKDMPPPDPLSSGAASAVVHDADDDC